MTIKRIIGATRLIKGKRSEEATHGPTTSDCATSLKSPEAYAWSRATSSRLVAGFITGVPLDGEAFAVGLVVAADMLEAAAVVVEDDDWW